MTPRDQEASDAGAPMRLRCTCLVINAPDELRVAEQDAGEPGPGQVVVQVDYGGICGSNLHCFHAGGFGRVRIERPMILGHEVAGTVVAVAPGVARVKAGDMVAVNPSRPCGCCRYCLEGLPTQCLDMRLYDSAMRDPHVEGAFRNLLVCDAVQCEPVAVHVPLQHAALAEPFSVALLVCSVPARCWASACWCRAAGRSSRWRLPAEPGARGLRAGPRPQARDEGAAGLRHRSGLIAQAPSLTVLIKSRHYANLFKQEVSLDEGAGRV